MSGPTSSFPPLFKSGKCYFNQFDQTGDFTVVRKGMKVYRTSCKKGGSSTVTLAKKVVGTKKPPPAPRDTILDTVERFTELDADTYKKYRSLLAARRSCHSEHDHEVFEASGKQRKLDNLQRKMEKETSSVLKGTARNAFVTQPYATNAANATVANATVDQMAVSSGYDAFSSDDESCNFANDDDDDEDGSIHSTHSSLHEESNPNDSLSMGEDSLADKSGDKSRDKSEEPSRTRSARSTTSSSESDSSSEDEVDYGDIVSVSTRDSAEFPRMTRTLIDGLADGADHDRERRWMLNQQKLYLRKLKDAERRLKMENPNAEFVHNAQGILVIKTATGKVEKKQREIKKPSKAGRRGSMIMLLAARKSGMSDEQLEEYRLQLMHRIGNCHHCNQTTSFCKQCKEYVDRYLVLNEGVRTKYNARKEAVYEHIKKSLVNKKFTVGVGDILESSVVDVIKYLKTADKKSKAWLQETDKNFYASQKDFQVEQAQSIYGEVDLDANCNGINMFMQDKATGKRRDGGMDPFFEKNKITDWVMHQGAEELYIKDDMQRPWTGNRERGEFPKKREAGGTKRASGVPMFVDVFVSGK